MVQFGLSGLDRHDVVHDGKYLFIKCINMKLGLFRSKFDAVTIFLAPFYSEETKIRRLTLTVVQG